MELIIQEDYQELSRTGADHVADVILGKPEAAIVVATGTTPMGMYQELADRYSRGELDTQALRIFQLDAYLGVPDNDPRSLYRWMDESLLRPLEIPAHNVTRLETDTPDLEQACRDFDAKVNEAGGFDLAILGLGPNGHLEFNEPPSQARARTRVVELTEASIVSNARYWGGYERVPRQAVTTGMDLLLAARHIVLLVSGAHKFDILHRTVEGPVTPEVPGSYLQEARSVTVIADKAAWFGEAQRAKSS